MTSEPETVRAAQRRHLDQLAELEEERRFLLRSLDDLEREHEAVTSTTLTTRR